MSNAVKNELVKSTQSGRVISLICGLDIGNGYVKGAIRNEASNEVTEIDMPSCASVVSHPQDLKPEASAVAGIIDDMYEQLDVVIGSHMVSENRRLYIGSRGLNSGSRALEFNVASHISKANDPLSVVLLLSCIAGKAIKDVWAQDGCLPNDIITVDTTVALALPIREYVKHGIAYRETLMKQPHMVTIHNFDRNVVFRVVLSDVAIVPEGVAAQYAITDKGVTFMQGVLAYARQAMLTVYGDACDKNNMLFQVTPEDVLGCTNTVGVDIGEGTVNYPVFRNGAFAADVSSNLLIGYGSVLSDALNELQDGGYSFETRKGLTEYLASQPSFVQRNNYNKVKSIVDNHVTNLVESITVDFSTVMNKAGALVEVVYVYGGGASPIQNELYKKLIDTMRVNQQSDVLLLYLDSSWSRNLNREGLLVVAEIKAKEKAAKRAALAESK